jgi:hypothetical protein
MARGEPSMKRLHVSKASGGHRSAKGPAPSPLASPLASARLEASPASGEARPRGDGAEAAECWLPTPLCWARC